MLIFYRQQQTMLSNQQSLRRETWEREDNSEAAHCRAPLVRASADSMSQMLQTVDDGEEVSLQSATFQCMLTRERPMAGEPRRVLEEASSALNTKVPIIDTVSTIIGHEAQIPPSASVPCAVG
jgi:hypothetical protein